MVSKIVALETVKRMLSSGIDDLTIRETLSDTGVSDKDADSIISEAKGEQPAEAESAPEQEQEKPKLDEKEQWLAEHTAEKTAEKVKNHIDEARTETELRETTAHAAIEEHGKKLDDLHSKVAEVHERVSVAPFTSASSPKPTDLAPLHKRFDVLEREIGEAKANTLALQDLLKKILSSNREILMDLQKKKK